jgi:hypothetical protein
MPMKPVDTTIKIIVGPLIDDTDFKTRETEIAYNADGMDIDVILEKTDGTVTHTAVTPTTGGDYDWAHTAQGNYELELPATGGASFNNTEEGILRIVGYATGVMPFNSVSYDIVKDTDLATAAQSDDIETKIDALPTADDNVTAIKADAEWKKMLSTLHGKIVKGTDGDNTTLAYYDESDTLLFTVTLNNNGRTVVDE